MKAYMYSISAEDKIGMNDFAAIQRYCSCFGVTLYNFGSKMQFHRKPFPITNREALELLVKIAPMTK
jgi:hypothetical protein